MKIAFIRAEDCVGCARCLPACPVDAIIGAPQFLHQVLTQECIGCGLCLAPCPMDCIEIKTLPEEHQDAKKERATQAKIRFQARQKRLSLQHVRLLPYDNQDPEFKTKMKTDILQAVRRVTQKRKESALKGK